MKIGKKMFAENKKIDNLNLTKLSNKQLISHLNKVYSLGNDICDIGALAAIPDLRHAILSTLLKNILKEKIEKYKLKKQVNDYFSVLITSTKRGLVYYERLAILNLAKQILKDKKLTILFKTKDFTRAAKKLRDSYPVIYKKLEQITKIING